MDGVRRVRREQTAAGITTTHFIDGWSEVKDGKLVRYLVHAEKRIAILADDDKRAAAGQALAPPIRAERTSNWEAGRKLVLNSWRIFCSLGSSLSPSLIASLLLCILGAAAWLHWLRPALLSAWSGRRTSLTCALLFGTAIALSACSGHGKQGGDVAQTENDNGESNGNEADNGVVWINELTSADRIFLTDLTGSSLGEADGLGVRKTEVSLYPYGFARHDDSAETNVYADSPRDRSVGLDHMGARFYSPGLGIWTSADPAILTSPEQYVTAEFAAANPYAYANLRPVMAADRDGQFWHVVAGAAVGGLIGGGMEAARQYVEHGKIESWGPVGAATGGGAISGGLTAAAPRAGAFGSQVLGVGADVMGGVAERMIASGGKDAGNVTDVLMDAGGSLVSGGGSKVLKQVMPKKALKPPVTKAPVAKVGSIDGKRASIGYHATHPEVAGPILAEGFHAGTKPGRLGSGGVYVNSTPSGALAEFAHHNPGAKPRILKVEYDPGVNANAMVSPRGYSDHLPIDADSYSAPSVRAPDTVNTNVVNGSARAVEIQP
jgi:RHS repeat-associated protein